MARIQSIRGFADIIEADEIKQWQLLEHILHQLAKQYGYQEVRLPFLEDTTLFARGIGETSDIVHKEMYTFTDKNSQSIALRPEGTASCVRSVIQNHALYNRNRKWYYLAPMFRRERPQKGRLRQFHQFGAESFGEPEPYADIEQLLMLQRLFTGLQLHNPLQLIVNYLGSQNTRIHYRAALQQYFMQYQGELSALDQIRVEDNPLRLLDSKDPFVQQKLTGAPDIAAFYSPEEQDIFAQIQAALQQQGVDFVVQPKLVRGLDYYSGLVYEWIPKVDPEQVTAQATICGGGRYNDLFSSLGATATSACGFSIGLERLLMHIEADTLVQEYPEKVLLVSTLDLAHYHSATSCSEMLRSDFKGLTVHQLAPQANMKSLLKQAMKWNAHYCIIAGASSDEQTPLLLKCMRSAKQVALNTTQLQQFFAEERML